MVSAVLVKVGDRVKAGQVLATQGDSSLQTQLAADEATVKADREVLVQANSPALTGAQLEQDNLQAQQAQTALSNAQRRAAVGGSLGKGQRRCGPSGDHLRAVAGDVRQHDVHERMPRTDRSRPTPVFRDRAPGGTVVVHPLPEPALTLSQDQAAVSKAQAQLPVAQAQAQQAIDTAQANANSAQAAVNLATPAVTSGLPGERLRAGAGPGESESGRSTVGAGAEPGQQRPVGGA